MAFCCHGRRASRSPHTLSGLRPKCTEQRWELGSDGGSEEEPRGSDALLLVIGVDVDLRRSDGTTALHLTIASQHARAAKLLLDFDADAAVATNAGVTPLLLAAENGLSKFIKLLVGQVEAVKMFLEAGVLVDLSNGAGRTPLMFAAGKDQVKAMKLLLAKGAVPNKTANDGNTALTIAAEGGHVEAVRFLLSHGARVNRSACPEVTALAAAAQNGHVELFTVVSWRQHVPWSKQTRAPM
ncbi:hypothetical protein PC128_g25252 [Phytophthora cactorum]|nr:hypothetical protein PC128_g25252 [Phytophthora cactorum]